MPQPPALPALSIPAAFAAADPCNQPDATLDASRHTTACLCAQVVLLCDLHGHSRKFGVFAYGCDKGPKDAAPAAPGWPPPGSLGGLPGAPGSAQARLFPLMLHLNAPDLFCYKSCNFAVREGGGCRGWCWYSARYIRGLGAWGPIALTSCFACGRGESFTLCPCRQDADSQPAARIVYTPAGAKGQGRHRPRGGLPRAGPRQRVHARGVVRRRGGGAPRRAALQRGPPRGDGRRGGELVEPLARSLPGLQAAQAVCTPSADSITVITEALPHACFLVLAASSCACRLFGRYQ